VTTTNAFPETADIETSSDQYALRFSGEAGQWMLNVQESIALRMLPDDPAATVLDVGGGHGQLAIPVAAKGHPVTVLGSDASCAHRIAGQVARGDIRFVAGNVIALPFEDRAFDVVMCFRLLTHCEQWPKLIAEMCRVARRYVIVDYPTSQSLNCLAGMFFKAKKKLEGDTRTYRTFSHAEVRDAFARRGFARDMRKGQFFFPMVMHRMLKSARLSGLLEACARGVGLTALWGSPIIMRAGRHE